MNNSGLESCILTLVRLPANATVIDRMKMSLHLDGGPSWNTPSASFSSGFSRETSISLELGPEVATTHVHVAQ